jgi:hypothetical protein
MILSNFAQLRSELQAEERAALAERRIVSKRPSRMHVYKTFLHNYYHNELLRVARVTRFQELLESHFDVSQTALTDFASLESNLFKFLDRFNARLAWRVYGKNKIVFDAEEVWECFNSVRPLSASDKQRVLRVGSELALALTPLSRKIVYDKEEQEAEQEP